MHAPDRLGWESTTTHRWSYWHGLFTEHGFWQVFAIQASLEGQSWSILHSGSSEITARQGSNQKCASNTLQTKCGFLDWTFLTLCAWSIAISFQRWPACTLFLVVGCWTSGTKCTNLSLAEWYTLFSLRPSGVVTFFITSTVTVSCTLDLYAANSLITLQTRGAITDSCVILNLTQCPRATNSVQTRINTLFRNTRLIEWTIIIYQTLVWKVQIMVNIVWPSSAWQQQTKVKIKETKSLQVKHSVEGSPPQPLGHLQTALCPMGVHWAPLPQGIPLVHGLMHWCWTQALLSGHSASLSHSPILTEEIREHSQSEITRFLTN
jgi:hypothetical protein